MEEETKQVQNKKKMALIIVLTVLSTLLLIYLIFSIYFIRHFYWGTTINDLKVGGRGVTKVEKCLINKAAEYTLTLNERNNESEKITGSDIDIKCKVRERLEEIKQKQNGFAWLFKLGSDRQYTIDKEYTYDEAKLKTVIKALKCFDSKHKEKPQDASVIYEKGIYVVKEGKKGNLIVESTFLKVIDEAITGGAEKIDLEATKCYKEAKYQKDSKEIMALKEDLNRYLKSEVTYQIGKKTEKLTADEIKNWLQIDKSLKPTLDRSQVEKYIRELAQKYDTTGKCRNFKTTAGQEIQISGGDYGWEIDENRETHELVKILKGYQPVNRSPIYAQEGVSYETANDIGNTYVEINLTSQYLWLYRDGKLVTEGSIVSGTADGEHATPPGVYKVDYKKRNAVLKGPGYACPVAFWMPFNGGIGMHDATWRGSFGGSIYLANGSHGCINCPYSLVETIYNNIEAGTPVVCYH